SAPSPRPFRRSRWHSGPAIKSSSPTVLVKPRTAPSPTSPLRWARTFSSRVRPAAESALPNTISCCGLKNHWANSLRSQSNQNHLFTSGLLSPQRGQYLLTPGRGTESLSSHHYYRQPLKAAVFFFILPLAARKRVHILLEGYLL